MPPPSASATRLAAHWVADALAADETIDFSAIKALVGVSPESLVGAPDATRERVALRCLQEVAAFAVADEGCAAAAPAGMLRVDAARSCEDVLVELTGQVGSSRSLDKDINLPFSQAIQNFICMKKPTLPETSLELLREVDPEIQSMASPSTVVQDGNRKHDKGQSLCNISHLHVNTEKPSFPTDSAELLQENLANVVNETDSVNFEKDPVDPATDLHQPCISDSRCYNHPQEDAIDAAFAGARSPEENNSNADSNTSVAPVPASASCNPALQGSVTESLSKKDMVDHTTVVQPQPCGGKSPDPPHCNDVKRANDDDTSDDSSKDPSYEGQTMQATMAPAFERSNDVLPSTSEGSHVPVCRKVQFTTEDTTMIQQLRSCKTHLNYPQHDSSEKVNQDLDDGSASIHPVENDHIHEEVTLRVACDTPSVSCNGAMQGDKYETNHPPGSTTECTTMFEQQDGGKSQLEVSCADKVNQTLHDDDAILERNRVRGGLNVQTAPESHSCNVALLEKNLEVNCLSKQNIGKNTADIHKRSCSISVPNSSQDGDGKRVNQISNKQTFGNTVAETPHVHSSDDSSSGFAAAACLLSMNGKMPFCSQDQQVNGSLGSSPEQDICIKCGKDGQLLQCSSCLLSAHGNCFGSSVMFEDSGQFHCPVCFYTNANEAYQKAKKTYIEARKNLAAFLGTKQLLKQHDEQQTGVLPRATNSEGQLTGCNSSKRHNCHQTKADDVVHQGEEPDWQRKKQKTNGTSDACPEVVTEKAPSVRNSVVAPMNKNSVLRNNSNQVQDAQQDHPVENTDACADAGNGCSSHEGRNSSQNRRSTPAANMEVEADKADGPTNSHQSEDSDEIEATSSNDSGKRSSLPWRSMRHHKAKLQEREAAVSSNSRKAFGQQDQHMPSPRKRNYAYPPKRYSNPVAPTGRRSKLCWMEEEEAALREAMEKFTPRDDGPIPWVQILEYGRDVFHRTRLPSDLRVKWRNMKKKAGS